MVFVDKLWFDPTGHWVVHNVCLKNKTIVLLPNVCGRGRGWRPALTRGARREEELYNLIY